MRRRGSGTLTFAPLRMLMSCKHCDDRYALEVIVGDDKSVARMLRYGADTSDPGASSAEV